VTSKQLSSLKNLSESSSTDAKPTTSSYLFQMHPLEPILLIWAWWLLIIGLIRSRKLLESYRIIQLLYLRFGEIGRRHCASRWLKRFSKITYLLNNLQSIKKLERASIYMKTTKERLWKSIWEQQVSKVSRCGSLPSTSCSEMEKNSTKSGALEWTCKWKLSASQSKRKKIRLFRRALNFMINYQAQKLLTWRHSKLLSLWLLKNDIFLLQIKHVKNNCYNYLFN